jgi:hypothetical protein
MINFPWAMSLLGVQQFVNALSPQETDHQGDKANATFDSVTHATQEQFDGAVKMSFEIGDALQRGLVDLTFGLATLESLNPTGVMRMACDVVQRSGGTIMQVIRMAGSEDDSSRGVLVPRLGQNLRTALPSLAEFSTRFLPEADRDTAWLEFQNKWEVIQLVADVDAVLALPSPGVYVPVTQLIERAYALEPFPALWAVEGLGDYYADTFLSRGELPRHLLNDDRTGGLPDKSLPMLHAGMGLSFAKRLMSAINPRSTDFEVRTTLQQFVALCKENARRGYVGCALESLGLATRTLYPEMVGIVDQQLLKVDHDAVSYFWHGVGRAIYFSPGLLLPGCGSPWLAFKTCWQEAPHELGLINAIAGTAWAVTLVNMRQPEIVEYLLSRHGERLSEGGAFPNGVASSLIVRKETTPDDPSIGRFCQHQPDPSDPRLVELWGSQVKRPCEEALNTYHELLKKYKWLEEVFHYQSLSKLVDRMKREKET